jgi:hypothetical protein
MDTWLVHFWDKGLFVFKRVSHPRHSAPNINAGWRAYKEECKRQGEKPAVKHMRSLYRYVKNKKKWLKTRTQRYRRKTLKKRQIGNVKARQRRQKEIEIRNEIARSIHETVNKEAQAGQVFGALVSSSISGEGRRRRSQSIRSEFVSPMQVQYEASLSITKESPTHTRRTHIMTSTRYVDKRKAIQLLPEYAPHGKPSISKLARAAIQRVATTRWDTKASGGVHGINFNLTHGMLHIHIFYMTSIFHSMTDLALSLRKQWALHPQYYIVIPTV